MTLIGFSAEKPHTRMGFTPRSNEKDFARYSQFTEACRCMVDGCTDPPMAHRPHGWTCQEHDWSAKKRTNGVKQ
mgnify:FL=1